VLNRSIRVKSIEQQLDYLASIVACFNTIAAYSPVDVSCCNGELAEDTLLPKLDIVLLKLLTAVNPEDIEVFVRATASAND
jgi:hypothetical protein